MKRPNMSICFFCRLVILSVVAMFILGGCSTIDKTWRQTKKSVKGFMDIDPSIDLKEPLDADSAEVKLGELVMPVDQKLESMLRTLESQDTAPSPEWIDEFMGRHSWVSGIRVIDLEGNILHDIGGIGLRQVDFAPILAEQDSLLRRRMQGMTVIDDLGSAIYVANPMFKDKDLSGLIIVSFEAEPLAQMSPNPQDLLILSTEGVLWSGENAAGVSSLASQNWEEILKNEAYGHISSGGGSIFWVGRFIGYNKQIIYALDAETARTQAGEESKERAAAEEARKAAEQPPRTGPEDMETFTQVQETQVPPTEPDRQAEPVSSPPVDQTTPPAEPAPADPTSTAP